MKTSLSSVVALLVLGAATARGQAILSFSGGLGTPITLTLSQSVAYTITSSTPTLNGPYFVLQNGGNIFAGGFDTGISTITYSINGGPAQSLNSLANNLTLNPSDLTFLGTQTGATMGSIVLLNAGTFTTSINIASPPPANGSFNTFVIDNNGSPHSGFGVGVPEPYPTALLASGAMGLFVALRRGRKSLEPSVPRAAQ